jgi:tetratricopeptide (TPR) repeat protein
MDINAMAFSDTLAANKMNEYLDIENREKDYKEIHSETFRTEIGIRAIGLIYHDHSDDQKSYDNVFRLKDNIEYRLFAASHQYLVFLGELGGAENYLQKLHKENPQYINPNTFPFGNPYFDKVELELSSIFDSIVFHLSSVFDYLSHALCYLYFENKEKTLYWTKLSKKVRGDFKGKYEFCKILDDVDRSFVGKLYDYRSRLLHNKRDRHVFASSMKLHDLSFRLKISCSEAALKHFKLVLSEKENDNQRITLTYLSSWLIKKTFSEIERILDSVKIDLEGNSHFAQNLARPKGDKGFMIVSMNPETKFAEPMSKGIWKEYKKKKVSG